MARNQITSYDAWGVGVCAGTAIPPNFLRGLFGKRFEKKRVLSSVEGRAEIL